MVIGKKLLFVLLLISLIGCVNLNPPPPGAIGGPVGEFYAYGDVPPGYAPPVDVFENNHALFNLSRDQFPSVSLTSTVDFRAYIEFNSTQFPPSQVVYPYNLIFRYGYIYDPSSACVQDTRCTFEDGVCCKGWRAFAWPGQRVTLTTGVKLVEDTTSSWINYTTGNLTSSAPKAFSIPVAQLNNGLNFILAYACKRVANQWKCSCATSTDCDKWMIQIFNVTKVATCTDKIKNQDESDVDCGGTKCGKCGLESLCGGDGDCQSSKCDSTTKKCLSPSCTDSVKNGDESDVDCGGSCHGCGDGKGCSAGSDCSSSVCASDKKCAVPSCTDTVKNGLEADVDCGGSCPTKCGIDKSCGSNADCASNTCDVITKKCILPPVTCTDGVKNGQETDVDCGGSSCPKCGTNKVCSGGNDCTSQVCTNNACAAPSCTDSKKNGQETDIDCGGSCATKCAVDKFCGSNGDCQSSKCDGTTKKCLAPNCADGVKNGDETDVDCGGNCAIKLCTGGLCTGEGKKCAVDQGCKDHSDCQSNTCLFLPTPGDLLIGYCVASCTDNIKDGDESDVDCGGSCATKCAVDKSCGSNADCQSSKCDTSTKKCIAPSCTDSVKNGDESDVDCGGSCSTKCAVDKFCGSNGDCQSSKCDTSTKKCLAPSCTDGVKNGDETDVDCGGSCPTKCALDKVCVVNGDCISNICDAITRCALPAPTCSDKIKNGGESDVDCGGTCPQCAVGKDCSEANECLTHKCTNGKCVNVPDLIISDIKYIGPTGNDMEIQIDLQNIGLVEATLPIELKYTIKDAETNDVKRTDLITLTEVPPKVAAGSSIASKFSITLALGSSIKLGTEAFIDPNNKIIEANYANNQKSKQYDGSLLSPPPPGK